MPNGSPVEAAMLLKGLVREAAGADWKAGDPSCPGEVGLKGVAPKRSTLAASQGHCVSLSEWYHFLVLSKYLSLVGIIRIE